MDDCRIKGTKNNFISLLHNKHHIISEILYNHITMKKKKNLNFINANKFTFLFTLFNSKHSLLSYYVSYAFMKHDDARGTCQCEE